MKIGGVDIRGSVVASNRTIIQQYHSGITGYVGYGTVSTPTSLSAAPSSTDGVQIFGGSITPTRSDSVLEFHAEVSTGRLQAQNTVVWLHVSGSATAKISTTTIGTDVGGYSEHLQINYVHSGAIVGVPFTFQVRGGFNTSDVFSINGQVTNNLGNTIRSFLIVNEVVGFTDV